MTQPELDPGAYEQDVMLEDRPRVPRTTYEDRYLVYCAAQACDFPEAWCLDLALGVHSN